MPKRTTKNTAKDKELPFEQALAELEKLVEEMEQDQLPLERLVEHYEKGSHLLARCEAVLDSARKRLETITLKGTAPSEDEAEESDDAPARDDADDEIRLF
jgi:exodeoxyribonuclease VII small subunit